MARSRKSVRVSGPRPRSARRIAANAAAGGAETFTECRSTKSCSGRKSSSSMAEQ